MSEVSKIIPMEENGEVVNKAEAENSAFKVCTNNKNLPAKTSFWSKLKGILTYEIKVELTSTIVTPFVINSSNFRFFIISNALAKFCLELIP